MKHFMPGVCVIKFYSDMYISEDNEKEISIAIFEKPWNYPLEDIIVRCQGWTREHEGDESCILIFEEVE